MKENQKPCGCTDDEPCDSGSTRTDSVLMLVDANGEVLDSWELDGYDLSKPLAQANLCLAIRDRISRSGQQL